MLRVWRKASDQEQPAPVEVWVCVDDTMLLGQEGNRCNTIVWHTSARSSDHLASVWSTQLLGCGAPNFRRKSPVVWSRSGLSRVQFNASAYALLLDELNH